MAFLCCISMMFNMYLIHQNLQLKMSLESQKQNIFQCPPSSVAANNNVVDLKKNSVVDLKKNSVVDLKNNSVQEYVPASSEKYIVDHAIELGYASVKNPTGCNIWRNPNATNAEVHKSLSSFATELDQYNTVIREFEPIPDLLKSIIEGKKSQNDICASARPDIHGLKAMFPSRQLSLTDSGYVEPLTPPMRTHKICFEGRGKLMSLEYLIHDFETMCRKLKPTSKRVLIDMGASLDFHSTEEAAPPIVELMQLYEKFGFNFDHIYAFEMTPFNPKDVFEKLLPEKYFPAYHWINVGVNHTEGHRLNPLHSILESFDEDDLIIVKLDIDTPFIELPLAYQLLNGGKDGIYHTLVDQFYFEHHVHLGELAKNWGVVEIK